LIVYHVPLTRAWHSYVFLASDYTGRAGDCQMRVRICHRKMPEPPSRAGRQPGVPNNPGNR
jgi:hypothetical protein